MTWLLDTNILLRLSDSGSVHHSACIHALSTLKARGDQLCICTQNAIEYFVVATRPREVNGLGKSAEQSLIDIRTFRAMFNWLPEPARIDAIWESLVDRYQIAGKQAHDARLVAIMVAHKIISLLTLNAAHFQRYAEIQAVSPHSILSSATP